MEWYAQNAAHCLACDHQLWLVCIAHGMHMQGSGFRREFRNHTGDGALRGFQRLQMLPQPGFVAHRNPDGCSFGRTGGQCQVQVGGVIQQPVFQQILQHQAQAWRAQTHPFGQINSMP